MFDLAIMNAEHNPAASPTVALAGWQFSYGWIVVGVLFLTSVLIQGTALGGITMFDDRVLDALGVSRGALKFRDSIYIVSTALACLGIGWVCERIGIRAVMVIGLALLCVFFLGYSAVQSVYVIYILHALLGCAFATAHVVVTVIVFSRWFQGEDPRRGIALGISAAGASFGAVVLSQLIALGLGQLPWRELMVALIALPVLLMPVVWVLVRPPEPTAEDPWGIAVRRAGQQVGFSFSSVLNLDGALLLLSIVPIFYVSSCISSHVVLLLRDQGLSLSVAAGGVGSMYLFGLIGKGSSGFLLLRMRLGVAWAMFSVAALAGSVLLALFPSSAYSPAIALIGLGWGGCFPLAQLRIADQYPGPGLARVLGVFVLCDGVGAALGAWLPGFLFDGLGSYRVALMLNGAFLAIGLVAFLTLLRRRRDIVVVPNT